MSSGMLLLAGLFATGPVTAPPEPAPMPRAKPGRFEIVWSYGSPVPVQPWETQRADARQRPGAARVPLLPPVREGFPAPICEGPPSDKEVLQAMPRALHGIPNVCEISRDDFVIVKNRLRDSIDAPRVFPLVGIARLHHCRWECVVHYTETVKSDFPFPTKSAQKKVAVICIDNDVLHAVDSEAEPVVQAAASAPSAPKRTLEFRIDVTPRGLTFGAGVGPAKPLPALPTPTIPMPSPDPQVVQPSTLRVEAGHGLRIAIPPLGSNPHSCPPPEVHLMMLQALNQMGGPVALPSAPAPATMLFQPTPVQATWTTASQAARPAGVLPVGTWTRVVGPVKYKLEIKTETLVLTTTLTEEDDDGKVSCIDHVLTADWYSTRNAGEVVGLVTGFDISTGGKLMSRDEVPGLLGSLADIQKQYSGKPIALTCRMGENDTLMIGDVRMPVLKEDYSELSAAFAAFGGNYKSAAAAPNVLTPVAVSRAAQLYSPNPNRRVEQLLYQSEDFRQMGQDCRPFRFNNQPGQQAPERLLGGIIDMVPYETGAAARPAIAPFPPQVRNGAVAEQTIWNWCFEPGSDRLTPEGRAKLDALAQDRTADARLYLQVARDLAATNDNLDTLAKERNDLTAKRAARLKSYMSAQPFVGKAVGYEVYIHDAVLPRPAVPPMPPPVCPDRVEGLTLPSGKYLIHYPQFFPSDPSFPMSREQRPPMPPPLPLPNPFRDGRFNW